MKQNSLTLDEVIELFSSCTTADSSLGCIPQRLSNSEFHRNFELLSSLTYDTNFPSVTLSSFCYSNLRSISLISPNSENYENTVNIYLTAILDLYNRRLASGQTDDLRHIKLFYVLNYASIYIRLYYPVEKRLFYRLHALCYAMFNYNSLRMRL